MPELRFAAFWRLAIDDDLLQPVFVGKLCGEISYPIVVFLSALRPA